MCDTQPACVGGALNEFIFSPRLDNLMMSYCCLTVPPSSSVANVLILALMHVCVCVCVAQGFLAASTPESVANDTRIRLVALFDNEEIGR